MKAAVTSEIVGIMLVVLVEFVFFTQVVPRILSVIVESFSKASAENVARQVSGLITVSGAATREIKIDYIPTREHVYDVAVKTRTIKVVPKFTVPYAEKASSTQPFAVGLQDYEEENVNHFIIEKNFDGASAHVFKAKKE
jgi:hypothetical protein